MEDLFNVIGNYFVPFVVTLSIVVFVHEFGHYWVARRCGVRVLSFSIGFGPEIWGRTDRHGTRWKVAVFPLGGYVRMFGDADAASTPDSRVHQMTKHERDISFFHQNPWKRLAIVSAGPVSNYLFAILLMMGMFAYYGEPYTPAVVDTVVKDSAAEAAGVKSGDRVVAIDGEAVERFSDMQRIIGLNTGTPMKVEIERDGDKKEMTITPRLVDLTDRFGYSHRTAQLGVSSQDQAYRKLSPGGIVTHSFAMAWNITYDMLAAVRQMIMGLRGTEELGGALRIAKMSGDVAKTKELPTYILFVIMISINLGLVNLFPIPMLDGGHMLFYVIEIVRRRPLTEKVQDWAMRGGVLVVLCLFIFSTYNDLVQFGFLSYLKQIFS
ncbi:MAG: M50 family metallopeptidase [Alphaproteobacteria bacterium]